MAASKFINLSCEYLNVNGKIVINFKIYLNFHFVLLDIIYFNCQINTNKCIIQLSYIVNDPLLKCKTQYIL